MTTSDPGNVLPTAVTEAGPSAAYREVEQLLRGAGWTDCGAGDWAFALASPDGALAARISPFDPVGPYTARLYERAAGTGLVPRMLLHHRLAGGADLLVMEQLLPVGESDAHAFLAAFSRAEGELGALASVVQAIHAEARRELYWCGPLDTNPSNMMRRPAGAGPAPERCSPIPSTPTARICTRWRRRIPTASSRPCPRTSVSTSPRSRWPAPVRGRTRPGKLCAHDC